MKKEYDFSNAERGKYSSLYKKGANIVMISPDVHKVFPNSDSVNKALRAIIKMTEQIEKPTLAKKRGR